MPTGRTNWIEFHGELDELRANRRLAAMRHRGDPPRHRGALLDGDLEGADYMIRGDDEIDARCVSTSRSAATASSPCRPGGQRPAPGRRRAAG